MTKARSAALALLALAATAVPAAGRLIKVVR